MVSQVNRVRRKWAYLFLLPSLAILILVAVVPLARTIWFSFTDASLADLTTYKSVGLDNYKDILKDPEWWQSLRNTVSFTVISVALETVFGLGIALVLNQVFRGRSFLRAAVMVPWAIPTVVSAKMWSWMFHDLYGVINDLLMKLHLISAPVAWLADPITSMAAVIFVDVWKTTPFMTLLILAGLQSIPHDIYQSAAVDGAGHGRTFFKITLPLIKPALAVAIIFRSLDALRVFDLIYIMTTNSSDTASISVYARKNMIDFQDLGYGSAISVLIFTLIALFTVIYVSTSKLNFVGGSSEKVN
jgi:trehalose/maltose transport system permease protein